MQSFEPPRRRPPMRKRSSIVPVLLIIAVFLYMSKRSQEDKYGDPKVSRTSRNGDAFAKQRKAYPEGPEGTVQRLEESLANAESNIRTLEGEKRNLEKQIADADNWLGELKTAYLNGKNGSPWPIPVRGKSYSEEQLTSKVQSLLEIREQLGSQLEIKGQHIAQAQTIANGVSSKLDGMRAEMARKDTERELEKLKQLSTEADKYVDQKAEEAPPTSSGPVRSLDELIKASEGTVSGPSKQKALQFLDQGK